MKTVQLAINKQLLVSLAKKDSIRICKVYVSNVVVYVWSARVIKFVLLVTLLSQILMKHLACAFAKMDGSKLKKTNVNA